MNGLVRVDLTTEDVASTGMPRLAAGAHRGPQDGVCLMEHVSVLAGETFGADPRCTHPAIAELARQVNDDAGDSTRAQLVRLGPDLITTWTRDRKITLTVMNACVRTGLLINPRDAALRSAAGQIDQRIDALRTSRFRRWAAGIGPTRLSAAVAVAYAFWSLTGQLHDLPRDEHDELLAQLLTAAIRNCRPLTARLRDDIGADDRPLYPYRSCRPGQQ